MEVNDAAQTGRMAVCQTLNGTAHRHNNLDWQSRVLTTSTLSCYSGLPAHPPLVRVEPGCLGLCDGMFDTTLSSATEQAQAQPNTHRWCGSRPAALGCVIRVSKEPVENLQHKGRTCQQGCDQNNQSVQLCMAA